MSVGSLEISPSRHRRHGLSLVTGLAVLLFSRPALAHGTAPHGPGDLWHSWAADPLVTIPLIVSSVMFALGVWRLRRSLGRLLPGFGMPQILSFAAGIAMLVIALLSPLEGLSKPLLSAHMVQHILLIAVAPPLLVLGKPEVVWLWALPEHWRRGLARNGPMRSTLAFLAPCARPVPAAMIHMATLWVWHSPTLFDAAVASDFIHWLEHLMFFGTALLFWRGIIKARTGREAAAAALIACFVTLLQSGLLSALLSFAREALYHTPDTAKWGLTALEDQQLAGAIMSLPMCGIYLIAGLIMAHRLVTPPGRERRKPLPVAPSDLVKQSS
ncbi:cytochrome c oxidase assembly protein [Microvirga sp. VF16]|uniref:cytochrome c oxidase assembly protein n=1 Tax=Microvirga sp. VF16 TaxID=2807101 RepID=UPI00193DDD67|nr:cytochrome c oxidase assembly protein [Microvirga sp. VF16]QRM30909.1 cytochrome c oxidase assembly protein [Microvirga sp. VF16]